MPYENEELPVVFTENDVYTNSEITHNAWFIENPINRELQKKVCFRLEGESEQEFIIVIKTPNKKTAVDLITYIHISILKKGVVLNQERKRRWDSDNE